MLPITGFGSDDSYIIGNVGDLTCSEKMSVYAKGPLRNTLLDGSSKRISNYTGEFNIEFDFEIEKTDTYGCEDFVSIRLLLDFDFVKEIAWVPRIQYCPYGKKFMMTHSNHYNEETETLTTTFSYDVSKLKIGQKYQMQVKQYIRRNFDYDELYFIKVNGGIAYSNMTRVSFGGPHKQEIVFNNMEKYGLKISNLKINV